MTAQDHGRLLNRLAAIPRILMVREGDSERTVRNGAREDGFADALRKLDQRVRKLESKV